MRQQKCRLLKKIPSSEKKFKILLKSAIKVAENSPRKMQILKDTVATFRSVGSEKQSKSKVSVLQLQFLWKSNRVKEHQVLVKQLLKDYGSMRKASLVEAREIGCVCDSCILSDGAACPNQAYCSPWKAINLETGKPLLDDKFKNLHWPLPLPNDTNDRFDRLRDSSDR